MNELTIFNFNNNQVRTNIDNNEPYFCLADVCKALELKNSRMATSVKDVKSFYTLTNGGKQELTFINEPNLYRLIFRSNKPQAQAFADWVYNEVLPSIRKTGGYGVPTITDDKTAMKAIGGLVKKCCAVVVRDELNKILNPEKTEHWEVNDNDLILQLYRWHATLNKSETLEFRRLHAENDLLRQKLEEVKKLLG